MKKENNYIREALMEFDEKYSSIMKINYSIERRERIKTFLKQKLQEISDKKVEEIRKEISRFIGGDEELELAKEIDIGLLNETEKQNQLCNRILNIKSLQIKEVENQEKRRIKSRLEIILTDPDNYLRGQLKDLIKKL